MRPSVEEVTAPEPIGRVVLFVVVTFAVMTLALIPVALNVSGKVNLPGPFVGAAGLVSVFGPLIGAVIVAARTNSLRRVFERLTIWRVGGVWYAVAIIGPLLLLVAAFLLYRLLGGVGFPWPKPAQLATLPALFLFVIVEAVGEEVGWRGFLLPALRTRYEALPASLIVGVVWWAWHMPLFFTARLGGNNVFAKVPPFYYLGLILGGAVLFTWVYDHTRQSTLIAVLMHGALNGWATVVLQNLTERRVIAGLFGACALVSIAAAVVVIFLTRRDAVFGLRLTRIESNTST